MATVEYRIVSGEESELHDEPHIAGSRITVRLVHERVEEGGLAAEEMADKHGLDVSDVYEALAYYHRNPREMRRIERRHEEAVEAARERSTARPPDGER